MSITQVPPQSPAAPAHGPAWRNLSTRGWIALVGVLALLLGGLIGYGLRWSTETTDTETVTQTVSAPAYAPGTAYTADVSFDGSRGYWNGPTEFTAGTTLTVHFSTAIDDGGLVIAPVVGANWDTVARDTQVWSFSQPPSYLGSGEAQDGNGSLTITLRDGTYGVYAGTSQQTTDDVVAVTMLRVTP